MNYSKFRITLDIHKHQSQVSIPVMYGDTAVQLYVTLSDGGMPYAIGKSCWAQFVAVKPGSSDPLLRKCIIENGTVIRLDFDEGIADVAGVYDCEIRLYGAEGKITSPCFTMVVDPRIAADYVGDGTENNFIDQIGTTMASFASAEEAREDAEAAREDAEAERVKAEEERQAANNSLVADVSFEVFDDGSIILQAFDSTGNEVSQSVINSIGTDTIADQAVTSKKIAPGAVKSSHLAQYAVGSYELEDGAVTEEKLNSAISDRLTRFGETDRDLDRRISLIEEHLEGASFVTDSSVAYEKAVPARACSSAKLASFGGMTYRDEETNTLRDSKVTEIVSRDTDGNVIAIRPIPAAIQAINEGKGITDTYYGAIADTVDIENKKYIKRINTVELTGNETFGFGSYYAITNALNLPKGDSIYKIRVSEAFPVQFSNSYLNNVQFGSSDNSLFNYFADGNAFKAYLAERYASGNPVTIIYVLAEPIETDISAELEGFDNIIKVEGGGSLEFVNEYKNPVPSAVKYLLKEESAV